MQKSDIRAVENPIISIFDLAGDVSQRAPKVRKLVTYSRAFIYLWMFIDFFLIIVVSGYPFVAFSLLFLVTLFLYSLRWTQSKDSRIVLLLLAAVFSISLAIFSIGPAFLVAAILILLYYLGWVILDLLRDLRRFFDYYVIRHNVIRAVREADPEIRIPPGPDPVSRLLTHLSTISPETAHVMARPNNVRRGVSIRGRSGVNHNFDAIVLAPPSPLWSLIGWAYPGWCILVKAYSEPPRLDDMKYLKHAAEEAVASMKVPPSRVIALWPMAGGKSVSEDTYQFVTNEVVMFRHRGDDFLCSMELIGEGEEGTYDLVPFIVPLPS